MKINLKDIDYEIEIISNFKPKDRLNELEEIPKFPNGKVDYWKAGSLLCEKDGGRLPTIEELQLIAILQKNKLINTDYSGYFWSSSDLDGEFAWSVTFSRCNQYITNRFSQYYVLCVR